MSFFAILRQDSPGAGTFSVDTCHINLWALGEFGRGSRFICDVGVLLTAQTEVAALDIALPFQVDDAVEDLQPKLLDAEIADLVWGEPVELVRPRQPTSVAPSVRFESGHEIRLKTISELKSSVDNAPERAAAVAHLILGERMVKDEQAYFRVRFRVTDVGRTWVWKRSGFGSNGALVDFRISDPRETWHSRLERDLRARRMPGSSWNFDGGLRVDGQTVTSSATS